MQNKHISFFIKVLMVIFYSSTMFADNATMYKIAMLADTPEIKDHSFHENVYIGLKSAEVRYKKQIIVDTFGSRNVSEYDDLLDSISSKEYNVVITLGLLLSNATLSAAKRYPNIKFISVDGQYNNSEYTPNLAGISFNEFQGGYLAGVLAGGLTGEYYKSIKGLNPDKNLGIIKGLDIPPVNRFAEGFTAGAKQLCPSCTIRTTTVGTFTDDGKVASAAKNLYESGADIIFVIAGAASNGAYATAQKLGKFVIETDTDQNFIASNVTITSALKRNDIIMDQTISDLINNKFEFGRNHVYGIAQNGIGLAPYHNFDSKIPPELKSIVTQFQQELKNDSQVNNKSK